MRYAERAALRVTAAIQTGGDTVSKAELSELAWSLAALCDETGSTDRRTFARLVEKMNVYRAWRGAKPIPSGRVAAKGK